MDWTWAEIEPQYQKLLGTSLTSQNVALWLKDWTRLSDLISERYARLNLAANQDTNDPDAERNLAEFLDQVYPKVKASEQKLKEKLLSSQLEPAGFAVPLRKMQCEAAIFRSENLSLLADERKLAARYDRIIGAQSVDWQGEERTLPQMRTIFQTPDRPTRQRAWRMVNQRQLDDRQGINQLWSELFAIRLQMAKNASFTSYRDFRWQQLLRLDYTPQDCLEFQAAIEQVAVPAATRLYERRRRQLGLDRLRPWDLDQDLYPIQQQPLPPIENTEQLKRAVHAIFEQLDPELGAYFRSLWEQDCLDLDNHKGKAPGAYCTAFPVSRHPFIFMNAVGLAEDMRTLIHEAGHAFHNFERLKLPYFQQRVPGLEFAEVASIAMELLTGPYLSNENGGPYDSQEAARARAAVLEHTILFWPYMAVVDAFQHWAYQNPAQAVHSEECDTHWLALWQRYIPGVDWSGLEEAAMTGWQRKAHIHRSPFYYVEYGLAQLGAVLIWRSAMDDSQAAIAAYRRGLALGGTATLPELYRAAGAKFAFDADTLRQAVDLLEKKLLDLEDQINHKTRMAQPGAESSL
jgi:oligoendopeptidase F